MKKELTPEVALRIVQKQRLYRQRPENREKARAYQRKIMAAYKLAKEKGLI